MVQHAEIEQPPVPSDFDFLRIERSGGITGAHEQVSVEPRGAGLTATVEAFLQAARDHELDAAAARRVLAASELLAGSRPEEPEPRRSADIYSYVVEVGWAGEILRIDVGAAPPAGTPLRELVAFATELW